jgi:restriction system protein
MARRRRQSPAEDFVDVVALAPWWVGVAVALVGYLVLHALAQRPISQPPLGSRPADYASSMWANVFTGLATFGQYAVPVLSLAGAPYQRSSAASAGDCLTPPSAEAGTLFVGFHGKTSSD